MLRKEVFSMDKRFALAGKCLWFLFLSVILTLAAAVAMIVPIIGWVAAPIMAVVGLVLAFYGPYAARAAHPNFQNAFYIALVSLALGIISNFIPDEGVLAGLVSIGSDVLNFLSVYFVCTAAGELLAEKGDGPQAVRADLIWKLVGGCNVVSILGTLIGWVPVLGALVSVAGVVAAIVSVVALVLEIIFYYKAANSLKAA